MKLDLVTPLALRGTVTLLRRGKGQCDIPAYLIDLGANEHPWDNIVSAYRCIRLEMQPDAQGYTYSIALAPSTANFFTRSLPPSPSPELVEFTSSVHLTREQHLVFSSVFNARGVWLLVFLARTATELLISRNSGSVYHALSKPRDEFVFV